MTPPPLFSRRPKGEPPPHSEWPRGTVELDEGSFDDFVSRFPLAAVEFWASWCGPCKSVRPVIRDLAERHRGEVAFGKVNIERHRQLAEGNGVMSVPYVVFFSYGKRVGQLIGRMNRHQLEGKVRSLCRTYGCRVKEG